MKRFFFITMVFMAGVSFADVVMPAQMYRANVSLVGGTPHVGERFTLRLTIKSLIDAPNTMIEWFLGNNNVSLLSGAAISYVSLYANDSVYYDYSMQVNEIGYYALGVEVSSRDEIHEGLMPGTANFYVAVISDTLFYADTSLGDLPYNVDIPDSFLMGRKKSKDSGFQDTWHTIHLSGTIKYHNENTNTDDAAPGLRMQLYCDHAGMQGQYVVGSWYTDNNGYYSKTFVVEDGLYIIFVLARTVDGSIQAFIPYYTYKLDDGYFFYVTSNTNKNYSTTITEDNDRVKLLYDIKAVKNWALNTFGFTRNFVSVFDPMPSFMPQNVSCYCPRVYWKADLWKTLWFGDHIFKYPANYWGRQGMMTMAHEWGHAFYYGAIFCHVVPEGTLDYLSHDLYYVTNPGFAWNEGFAEFIEYASTIDDYPYHLAHSRTAEDFYKGGSHPFYLGGSPYENPDGRKVEGAVMQYLYDLWDDTNTPDAIPLSDPYNFDDENISSPSSIMQTFNSMTTDWEWEFYDYWGGIIGAWYQAATEPVSVEVFKNHWDSYGYPGHNELYNVVIHPFTDTARYNLPDPYALTAILDGNRIWLYWQETTVNEGGFWIRRKIDNGEWDDDYALVKTPNQHIWYDDNVSEHQYTYKVCAITADTSNNSNEASAQGPPEGLYMPTNLACITQSPWNCVSCYWDDNAIGEGGYEIWRMRSDSSGFNLVTTIDGYPGTGRVQWDDHSATAFYDYLYQVRAFKDMGGTRYFSDFSTYGYAVNCPYFLPPESQSFMHLDNISARKMAYGNNILHIIFGSGNDEALFYTTSTDKGSSWSLPQNITAITGSHDRSPALALIQSGAPVVAWIEEGCEPRKIFYRYQVDGIWGTPLCLREGVDYAISMIAIGSTIYITWLENNCLYCGSFVYNTPSNMTVDCVDTYGNYDGSPCITNYAGIPHIVWCRYENRIKMLYHVYKSPILNRDEWSLPMAVGNGGGNPIMAVYQNKIYCIAQGLWPSGDHPVYAYNGFNWTQVSSLPYLCLYRTITSSTNNLIVTLIGSDERVHYYKWENNAFVDQGMLTGSNCYEPHGLLFAPNIAKNDYLGVIHIDQWEMPTKIVFLRRMLANDPQQNPHDGTQGDEKTTCKEFSLLAVYPIPARTNLNMQFSMPDQRTIHINIYDETGRLVKTMHHRNAALGIVNVQIPLVELSPGIYFLQARTTDYKEVRQLVIMP